MNNMPNTASHPDTYGWDSEPAREYEPEPEQPDPVFFVEVRSGMHGETISAHVTRDEAKRKASGIENAWVYGVSRDQLRGSADMAIAQRDGVV